MTHRDEGLDPVLPKVKTMEPPPDVAPPPRATPVPSHKTEEPPAEFMQLRTDITRSVTKLRNLYRQGEAGNEELEATIKAAELLRDMADGYMSGTEALDILNGG